MNKLLTLAITIASILIAGTTIAIQNVSAIEYFSISTAEKKIISHIHYEHNHHKANFEKAMKILPHNKRFKECLQHREDSHGLENYDVDNCLHGKDEYSG